MSNQLTRIFVQSGITDIRKKQIILSEKAKKFAELKIESMYSAPNLEVYWQINPDESRQLKTARLDTYHTTISPLKWMNCQKRMLIDCANVEEVFLCDRAKNFTAEEYEIFGCPNIRVGEEYYGDDSANSVTKSVTITCSNFRLNFNNWLMLEKFKLNLPSRLSSENGHRSYFYSDHIKFKNCPNLKEVDLTAIKSFSNNLITFKDIPPACIIKFANPSEFYSDIHLGWYNSIAKQMFQNNDNKNDRDFNDLINDQCRLKIQLTDLFPEYKSEKIISVTSLEIQKRLTDFVNNRYLSVVKQSIEHDKQMIAKLEEKMKTTSQKKGDPNYAK